MKVKDLPIKTVVLDDDLLYIVDDAAGTNGGRKVKASDFKSSTSLTDAEVKTKYENNANTNAFTDTEQSKLSNIANNATADAAAVISPPPINAAGGVGTDTNTYANSDHTHSHGSQLGGNNHDEATEISAGFLSATDKIKLNDLAFAFAQYQMDLDHTQVGVGWTPIASWNTDLDSFLNGQLTRVSGTVFRVEQACAVEISYDLEIDANSNNTGAQVRVEINGTQINRSLAFANLRSNGNESFTKGRTFLVNLAASDLISFSVGNREGNSVTAVSGNGASTMSIKIARLL